MKTRDASNLLLFFSVLLVVALIMSPMLAHATGKPEPTAGQNQAQQQSQALDMSLMNNPVHSYRGGNSYSFVGGQAPALPPGLCPKSKSSYRSFILFTWSDAENGTDMECLDKVLAMMRDTAPKPAEIRYVSIMPPAQASPDLPAAEVKPPVACTAAPAPKKPVAPKKHVKKSCP